MRREQTADEIESALNKRFSKEIPQANVFSFGPPAIPGLGNGSGFGIMIQDKGEMILNIYRSTRISLLKLPISDLK